MKKYLGLVSILVLILLFPASAVSREEKDQKYQNWLKEEVALLINEQEANAFEALKTDEEKDKFIEIFWAKRDPSPGTQANEFKDIWYQRLDYINNDKSFKRGSRKGWRSDMGKVYLFFGPPMRTSATKPTVRSESVGGSQMEPASEIWTYQAMPDLNLHEPFRVVFREYQFGYELDLQNPQIVVRAMEMFPKVVIFNPDIKDIPRYKFILDQNSFEGKLINEFIATGNKVEAIPLEWKPFYFKALNGDTLISFLVQIDVKKLDKKNFNELTFFGHLQREDGSFEDFLQSHKPDKPKSDKILTSFGFSSAPGKATLFLGARGSDQSVYTLIRSELDVPEYGSEELDLGTFILSPEVVRAGKPEKETTFNPYVVGELKATPRWGNSYKPSEFLSVLFHIYNAKRSVEGTVSLKIEFFISSNEVTYKLNPEEVSQKVAEGEAIISGTQIPLQPLNPGKYTFKVKITDSLIQKSIEKTADFIVE